MRERNREKLTYFGAICFLKKYVKKHMQSFFLFYLGFLFDLVLGVVLPIVFGIMIDEIVYKENVSLFLQLSGMYVVMALFSCALYFLIYAHHHYLMNMYTLDIRLDIFQHLMKADAQYMADQSTGDTIALLQKDVGECMHFMIRNVIHFGNGILGIVLVMVYLFKIDWRIGLFSMIAAPLSVLINTKFGKKIRGYGKQSRKIYGEYISWVHEMLSALRDVRMLGAQNHVETQFEEYHEKLFKVERKSGMSSMTAGNLVNLSNLLIRLGIYGFAGFLASKGAITIGLLTVVLAFYESLTSKISRVSGTYLDGQNRIATIQKIHDFMKAPTEETMGGEDELVITNGKISMEKVSFAYKKGSEVLSDFNLEIQPGEKVALTGKSGSGKSTLAYLLLGFYRPEKGRIQIDGQDLSKCSLKSIRNQIGLVAQDVLIIPGTIRENICLGNRKATNQQVENVCKQAGLWDFILTLPEGLNTVVGFQGRDLSGGQKQRVAIARIYLKNPKILIFDEATSALDSETEEEIHKAWNHVLKGKTAIVIAHRESSVMLCDRAVAVKEDVYVC